MLVQNFHDINHIYEDLVSKKVNNKEFKIVGKLFKIKDIKNLPKKSLSEFEENHIIGPQAARSRADSDILHINDKSDRKTADNRRRNPSGVSNLNANDRTTEFVLGQLQSRGRIFSSSASDINTAINFKSIDIATP